MDASAEVSRSVHPFPLPSLSSIALIQVAIPLWEEFGFQRLYLIFEKNIRPENYEGFIESSEDSDYEDSIICTRAEKKIVLIPSLLRKRVWEAIYGLELATKQWEIDHWGVFELEEIAPAFYWQSDGRIDRIKTAQQLVMNPEIDIVKRFRLACMYCLEASIHTLWVEMVASGKTKGLKARVDSMEPFWIGRLQSGSQIPWVQAALEYLEYYNLLCLRESNLAWICFFPMLRVEDRRRFLPCLKYAQPDDMRLCLYTMTAKEEELALQRWALEFLWRYFEWPLRHLFLETAEKLWKYIDEESYCTLLDRIFGQMSLWKDFGYFELFENLWDMSPNNFRESAEKCSRLKYAIDLCLGEARKSRETGNEMLKKVSVTVLSGTNRKKRPREE